MKFLTEEEKKLLLDRYVDIEWPDDVADLQCVRCQCVVINHHVSNCQHFFCNNCRRVFSDGGQWKCPQCQEYVTQLDEQDFDVEIKMHKLRIFCPNKKYGCKYEDQLTNIPKHLILCVNTREAALPVEYKGSNRMEALDNELTKRIAAIGELNEEVNLKYEEQVKKIDDMNRKLNEFTEQVDSARKRSEDRRNTEIKLQSMRCSEAFRSMTSLLKSVDKNVQQHETLVQEMKKQVESNMREMRTKIASMSQKMDTLQFQKKEVLNPLETETYKWSIKKVAQTIREDKWRFQSGIFKFTGYEYEIRAHMEKNDGLFVVLQFKEGNIINDCLNKNGFTSVKYIVEDQGDNLEKKDIIIVSDLRFYDCFGKESWIFESVLLPAVMLSPPYVKNDCIKMRILFEPSTIDRNCVSNNGFLKWRVDDYKAWKVEVFYHDTCSPSFYTSQQGYRVKTQLGINFKGTMLVVVHFLTGEHDDLLSINFPHKTTVTLFNQSDPSNNLVIWKQREDVNLYAIEVDSISFIEENGFIQDDSLTYSVRIEPVISKLSTKWA